MGEWLIRNIMIFVMLILLSRFVAPPRLGKAGVVDLVMLNAIGDLAAHTVFETQHPVLPGAASLAAWMLVLAGLTLLSARWPTLERNYFRPPVQVVKSGLPDEQTLKDLGISRTQLETELRGHGIPSLDMVREATLEPDGSISVIREVDAVAELTRLADALAALAAKLEAQKH